MCDAGSEPALDLLCLPWGTIGKLWPAERVVMGLRVCKVLRHELLEHVHQVTLIKSKGTAASDLALAKDLARFGEQNAVTLTWGDGRNHSCSSVLQVAIPTSCYACWATSTVLTYYILLPGSVVEHFSSSSKKFASQGSAGVRHRELERRAVREQEFDAH